MSESEISNPALDGRGLPEWVMQIESPEWVMQIESAVENNKILNTMERNVRKKHTIYKIPEGFISDKKREPAYKPQLVSMGPYHHGEDKLLPMEEHKRRALRQFLLRTGKSIREYRDALSGVVQELMDSYKDLQREWKGNKEGFVQLMIFDGCFMMELLITDGWSTLEGYDEDDAIFSRHGMLLNMPRIRRDMLVIENQIPLLVLKKLLSVAQGLDNDQDERSLNQKVNNMVSAFFGLEEEGADWTKQNGISTTPSTKNSDRTNTKKSTTEPPSSTTTAMPKLDSARDKVELGLHALDVVRKSMIKDIKGGKRRGPAASSGAIWPATKLKVAGITFRRSDSTSLKDIDFSRGYLYTSLSLPQLVVADDTEYKFLNLMAFERLHVGSGNEVSSYVCFMALIIDSDKDVILLSESNIIKNFVGTDQAVADLFHRIAHDVPIDTQSRIFDVHDNVIEYCRGLKGKAAYFCNIFFFSAWVWISSLGIVFLVTCLQLLYAMLDFYQKN